MNFMNIIKFDKIYIFITYLIYRKNSNDNTYLTKNEKGKNQQNRIMDFEFFINAQ